MTSIKKFFARLWRDGRGISSVEYALLLAFVAVGVVTAAGTLSNAVQHQMTDTASCLTSTALCN